MKRSIATVGDTHTCPMVTGGVPHVGGPIIGPGCPGVTIDGKPIAVVGDVCACSGEPDTIVTGCSGVTIDGKPIALVGDLTAHGGVITTGCPGVTISCTGPMPRTVMPLRRIPFPKITLSDITKAAVAGLGDKLREAEAKQNEIREMAKAPVEPLIYNIQWMQNERIVTDENVYHKIKLVADTMGYEEGETVSFDIMLKDENTGEETKQITLEGQVSGNQVVVEWERIEAMNPKNE